MNYVILAIISMLAFGIMVFFYKLASSHFDPITLTTLTFIGSTSIALVIWIFTPNKIIEPAGLKYIIILSVLSIAGMFSLLTALKLGPVSIVSPIRNMALLVSIILAIVFLGEELTLIKGLGIVFGVIALILLSM